MRNRSRLQAPEQSPHASADRSCSHAGKPRFIMSQVMGSDWLLVAGGLTIGNKYFV